MKLKGMEPIPTFADMWNDYRQHLPVMAPIKRNAIQLAFYMGAWALYCILVRSHERNDRTAPHVRFEEVKAYLKQRAETARKQGRPNVDRGREE